MSAEETKVEAPAAAAEAKEAPVQNDPYEGLNADEREDAEYFDNLVKKSSPKERATILRLAREGNAVAARAMAEKSQPAEPEKKAEPVSEIEQLKREQAELRKMLKDRDDKENQEKTIRDFNATVNSVLDDAPAEIADDPDYRDDILQQCVGQFLKTKPGDLKAMVKRIVDKHSERIGKIADEKKTSERREYAANKARDARATRGDSARGGSPAKVAREFTADDFNSGRIADELAKEFA